VTKTYKCRYCGKEFTNIYALAGHIRMSHPKRRRRKRSGRHNLAQQGTGRLSVYSNSIKKYTWRSVGGDTIVIKAPERVHAVLVEMDREGYLSIRPAVIAVAQFIRKCGLGDYEVREKKRNVPPFLRRLKRQAAVHPT